MGVISFAAFRPKPGKDADLLAVIADRLPLLRRLGLATDREHIVVRTPSGIILEVSEWVSQDAIDAAHHTPDVLTLWNRFSACSDYLPPNDAGEFAGMFPTFPAVIAERGAMLLRWGQAIPQERPRDTLPDPSPSRPAKIHPRLQDLADRLTRRRPSLESWTAPSTPRHAHGPSPRGIAAAIIGSPAAASRAALDLSRSLHADLYRIDLSAVTSNYIGETEKNLRRIFDAAERSNSILFFDDADALFGRRSSVKDAHDRYANLEIGYLLGHIEQSSVLALLAANRRDHIDPAFIRRLDALIEMS
ncbi:MAG: ATP-binding protein [Phycisphaerales bacterium]